MARHEDWYYREMGEPINIFPTERALLVELLESELEISQIQLEELHLMVERWSNNSRKKYYDYIKRRNATQRRKTQLCRLLGRIKKIDFR